MRWFIVVVTVVIPLCNSFGPVCDIVRKSDRFDCHPDQNPNEGNCVARGCCWDSLAFFRRQSPPTINTPFCYFPRTYPSYNVTSWKETDYGYRAVLERTVSSPWPKDVKTLTLDVWFETQTRLHLKIYDPSSTRYEVPIETPPTPKVKAAQTDFDVKYSTSPFGLKITRKSNGAILFDTTSVAAPLIYADQFLQISLRLSSALLYGLGEHMSSLLHNASTWQQLAFWNLDHAPSKNANLYGTHPFYLNVEPDSQVHGVFLLNSNAMEIDIQPAPALTFRTIGGILDFYIFTGPSAEQVVQQYVEVVGRPLMPPYWALGFHLCRYNYNSVEKMKLVINRNRKIQIPYDVQWNDIDYMRDHLDWTYDEKAYHGLPEVVADLHSYGQKYVIIVSSVTPSQKSEANPPDIQYYHRSCTDPGLLPFIRTKAEQDCGSYKEMGRLLSIFQHLEALNSSETDVMSNKELLQDPGISTMYPGKYPPYDSGITKGVFVLNATGMPLIGRVWPGNTVFPDFTHPDAAEWWYDQASEFHKLLPFDGLWTDMNEPSNFVFGSLDGCTKNNLDNPPYVPGIYGGQNLAYNTLCASAKQFLSSHYNLHSLYGLTEVNATNVALKKIRGKRSLIISRSSFPSSGRYGSHWTGDVSSSWEDLYFSIPAILEFQFYGIPLVGADICGFSGDTTEELCIRWMQLGAFYPFMRNHNDDKSKDQDPAAFSLNAQRIMKSVLQLRYTLLPHFYTHFFQSHIDGSPVIKPLFFHSPNDIATYRIDRQFMWGSSLLISPVLEQGSTSVSAYLPKDLWYDIYDGHVISGNGEFVTLKAPLEKINVHVRGGSIIPMQPSAVTTTIARTKPFGLLAALNSTSQATGILFWDDGESLDNIERGEYNLVRFTAVKGSITSEVLKSGFNPTEGFHLNSISILGVSSKPSSVTVNGQSADFHYHDEVQELRIASFLADLHNSISVLWH